MPSTPQRDTCRSGHPPWLWLWACVLWFGSGVAQAVGLGDIRVQSSLGQPLRASIPLFGNQDDDVLQVCVKARALALDGSLLMALRVTVSSDPRAPALVLTSTQNVPEPALVVVVQITCDANIARNYQVLLDPPESAPVVTQARAVAAVAPSEGAAPQAAAPRTQVRARAAAGNQGRNSANNPANNPANSLASRPSGNPASSTEANSQPVGQVQDQSGQSAASSKADSKRHRRHKRDQAEALDGMSTQLSLASRPDKGKVKNVLKVDKEADTARDLAGNPLPGAAGRTAAGANPGAPLPDGPGVKLLLSRRLSNDTSPLSKAAEATFSETVRKEQNQAVLLEVGRAEVRTMQKQIELLEAEIARLKKAAPQPGLRLPSGEVTAMASGTSLEAKPATPAMDAETATGGKTTPNTTSNIDTNTHIWLIGLAATLFICLMAIGWLLWRLIQLRSRQLSFSASVEGPGSAPATLESASASAVTPAAPKAVNSKTPVAPPAVAKAPASKPPVSKPVATPSVAKAPAVPRFKSAPASSVALPSIEPARPRHEPEPDMGPLLDEPLEFTFPEDMEPMPAPLSSKEAPERVLPKELFLAEPDILPHPMPGPRGSIDYATETEIPTVEEFTDVMYEAEFWISLNKLDNAIRVLEQYTAFENVSSPLPWLFLFDMYHKTDGKDQYTALQRQFERMFNGKIPDYDDYDAMQQSMGLENMQGLMGRIESYWMSDEILPFLENLLVDDRDGTRQGFELGVYRDILFLIDIAKEVQKSSDYEKFSTVFKLAPME